MSERDTNLLLGDILEAALKILKYTENLSFDQFLKDDKTSDAVIRNFEIIGEASARLPEEFKIENLEINWRRLKGFRNRLIHDYFGIDYKIVWEIILEDLPELKNNLEQLFNDIS